jgi:hypothetical protein
MQINDLGRKSASPKFQGYFMVGTSANNNEKPREVRELEAEAQLSFSVGPIRDIWEGKYSNVWHVMTDEHALAAAKTVEPKIKLSNTLEQNQKLMKELAQKYSELFISWGDSYVTGFNPLKGWFTPKPKYPQFPDGPNPQPEAPRR